MTEGRADVPESGGRRVESDGLPSVLGGDERAVWAWAGFVWSVALILMILMAIPATADALQTVDDRVWQLAVDSEWTPMVALARALGIIGSAAVIGPIVLAGGVLLWRRRRRPDAVAWMGALAVARLLSVLLKALYERPRPPASLIETSSFSFPSGHAVTAGAFALAAALVWIGEGARRRWAVTCAVCWALLIAVSRVYLRAHWLTDVAAGVALGVGVALVVIAGVDWWSKRRTGTGKRTVAPS